LPKIETKSPPAEAHTTPFYDDLVYFLKATTLHINLINRLKEFDFSETKRYAFVHSVYVHRPHCFEGYIELTIQVVVQTQEKTGDALDTLV
jgi:hypothetical protein